MFRLVEIARDSIAEEELGGVAQDRIGVLGQESPVAAEGVVVPQMHGDPGAAGREHAPVVAPAGRAVAPGVRDDLGQPARQPVQRLRRAPSGGHQALLDPAQERRVACSGW